MDIEKIKAKLSKLRDMDAPAEVIQEYEDTLANRVKQAMGDTPMSYDPTEGCWVEDHEEGIPLGPSKKKVPQKAVSAAPGVTVVLKIGG